MENVFGLTAGSIQINVDSHTLIKLGTKTISSGIANGRGVSQAAVVHGFKADISYKFKNFFLKTNLKKVYKF